MTDEPAPIDTDDIDYLAISRDGAIWHLKVADLRAWGDVRATTIRAYRQPAGGS